MTAREIGAASRRLLCVSVLAAFCAFAVFAVSGTQAPLAAAPGSAPAGLTAIALDGAAGLAWQPVAGATSYAVFRGTSAGTVTDQVSPPDLASTQFKDTSAANGTTYFYAVRAYNAEGASPASAPVDVRPRARTCSSDNPIVAENCFPGTTAWRTPTAVRAYDAGIEGFASASSVDAGGSVDLRIKAAEGVPYHIDIYRTGSYNGTQGRLISSIHGLQAPWQPECFHAPSTTGVTDCAGWSVTNTITTTADWTTGTYLLKLVRDDNGNANEILLVVRRDGNHSALLYTVPTLTYQAYNNYDGKSLYDFQSSGSNTVTGTTRAVNVSFDRPYSQPSTGSFRYDWYSRIDVAAVAWFEAQGLDVSYIADEDLDAHGAQVNDHKVVVFGGHHEYWTQNMQDAAYAARDAGTSLFFLGANSSYWKVRLAASTVSGRANRVEVGYKSIEGGPADPTGAQTTTWRDPAGPNRPENALAGQMYIGDNSGKFFPLRVSAAEGRNRLWRYTSVADLAPGTTASIGSSIVGWEWDARVNNGAEPANVSTLASTPVDGNLVQANGASYTTGSAIANTTAYRAASGAIVFATGTNHWYRGLGTNVYGDGEPSPRIQQLTMNVLVDAGVTPATPAGTLTVDPTGTPQVTSTSPSAGAGGVAPNGSVTATFDRQLDPGTVDSSAFTLTGPDGPVAASVSIDNPSRTLTLKPTQTLEPATQYVARLTTQLEDWRGTALSDAVTIPFTTGPGTPPVVASSSPAAYATGVFTDTAVTATFDRRLDPATVTTANFTVADANGTAVSGSISYDDVSRSVRFVPGQRLGQNRVYTVTASTAITARDGLGLTAPAIWTFTTGTNLAISDRMPGDATSGISPATAVRVTFSRAADPSTISAARFTLADPGGNAVPASVSYDGTTRIATLVPSATLATSTTYTATVSGAIRATDGAPLDGSSWTFTTAASMPPAPSATGLYPAAGATGIPNDPTVRASFDIALDPATVNSQTVRLTPAGGSPVSAAVTYDAANRKVILAPSAPLATGVQYTATLTTGVRSTVGTPLAADLTWTFTTARCPCSLLGTRTPDIRGVPVRDGRSGTGPFTYEMGTKITVTDPSELIALRYYRDAGETGTHVGRVWNSAGQQVASVTFADESASGWQRQTLNSPITLQPGSVYTVSVGLNAFYVNTIGGLRTQIVSGPLRSVADGANGVYANAAGQFPNQSWNSSSYSVDGVVRQSSEPGHEPQLVSSTPTAGATGVATGSDVKLTFAQPLDPATVRSTTVRLTDGGTTVAAAVAYDDELRQVTLTPSQPLEPGTTYTVTLTTGLKGDDETPLAPSTSLSFSTVAPGPPVVLSSSPATGAQNISASSLVTAVFDQSMTASTLNTSTFTLTAGGTAVAAHVSYDSATHTATLDPNAALTPSTTYTATLSTGVRSSRNVALAAPVSWTFTTSACPCKLFDDSATPALTGLSTANGRGGSGWTLELGTKVKVTQAASLQAVRFYKDSGETGTHVARIWTAGGTLLTSVTFSGETASGWQQKALGTPLALTPGQTYVVSVGFNARFGMTISTFANPIVRGPLESIADGANGVFADNAGVFPTQSWSSSGYFVDAVVG